MAQIGRYAGNHPIQASSADMLKESIEKLYLYQRGWDGTAAKPFTAPKVLDSNLLIVCHDEMVTDAVYADVERQSEMLSRAMTEAYNSISMVKTVNGVRKTFHLKDIKIDPKHDFVETIVADYWAKD